jgi:aconitate hydratase 2/2-methylisocitrate dehydratase
MPVEHLKMGDVIDIFPYEGVTKKHGTEEVIAKFSLKSQVLLDEVRAGGRIPMIIGKDMYVYIYIHI